MGTKSAWTPERRAKQAERIRQTKPWTKSTGPQTVEGKAISSRNADKGVAERRRSYSEDKQKMRDIMKVAEAIFGRFRFPTSAKPIKRHRLPTPIGAPGDTEIDYAALRKALYFEAD